MASSDSKDVSVSRTREHVDTAGSSDPVAAMTAKLGGKIIGQPRAVEAVAQGLEIDEAGLLRPGQLAMKALFVGPPGVGKTQMAYELAKAWIGELLRDGDGHLLQPISLIDCTQYADSHDIANLRGSTKGYVGYEDKTPLAQENIDRYAKELLLAEELDVYLQQKAQRYPSAKVARVTRKEREQILSGRIEPQKPFKKVILFDEIGRGHRNIWNILITILNAKPFEFGDGTKADFSRAALLMSDNTNEKEIREIIRGGIGFRNDWREADQDKLYEMIYRQTLRRVEKVFPPAFVSRIRKNIIGFRPLGDAEWGQILDLRLAEIVELFQSATGKDPAPIEPVFTPECKALLIEKGIDRIYGARPLEQVLEKHVVTRLAKAVNAGKVKPGQRLIFERERKPKDRIELYVEK